MTQLHGTRMATRHSLNTEPPGPLAFQSVHRAGPMLAGGQITAVQLVDACQAAFAHGHARINAMVLQDFARARADAAASDARRGAGQARGPLDGIPFTVKESFDVAGWPTTCGDPAHRDHVAAGDAIVVARLRAQGAVLLGKTNVPVSLRDW